MINKHIFDSNVQSVTEIAHKYQLDGNESDSGSITAELARFNQEIRQYAFRILMLGVFSSGKSAFLNKLLQEPLLTEAQNPETTIATELRFDLNPRIEAVAPDNSVTQLSPEQLSQIDNSRYSHLVYHLNNEFLKKHSDLIFVDMPGIDSSLENHNKAITRYIGMGSAYILLVSSKEGGLRQSLIDFLTEISHYPQSLSCFVSMSDLLMPSEIEQVTTQVEARLCNILYEDIPVQAVSARIDSDENFTQKVEEAVGRFDPQLIFNARYGQELCRITLLLKAALSAYKDSCTLNTDELDAQIKKCIQTKKELQFELNNKQRDLQRQSKNTSRQICDDVRLALEDSIDRLAHAALSGEEAFKSSLMSIIRPVLLTSSQQRISENYQEFIDSLDLSSLNFNTSGDCDPASDGKEIAVDFISKLSEIFQSKGKNSGEISNSTLYSAIAGVVAISTSILNPILELILVFLPQIAQLLLGQSKEDQERNQLERIKSELRARAFPEICDRIRDHVDTMVAEQNQLMLDELRASFNQLIETQETALKQAQKEITARTDSHRHQISDIENDLSRLDQILARPQGQGHGQSQEQG